MRTLNMWHRLGIVASVLWLIGGGIWQRTSDLNQAERVTQTFYQSCSEIASQLGSRAAAENAKCMNESTQTYALVLPGWADVAIFAFAPIAAGWVGIYLLIWITRWVLAGRKISN